MPIVGYNVTINPFGQQNFGFVGLTSLFVVSGYGLNTFGFIWAVNDIWVNCDTCSDVTWTDCPDDQC